MRTSCVLAAVGLLLVPACRAASSAKVIAAAATSSSPGAATAICLLKTDCTGWWSPGSLDSGANEGIYVQLESTIDADVVEFTTNAKDATRNFNVSVNGALVAAPATTRPISGDEYVARYTVPGGHVKSVFLRLSVLLGGRRNFRVFAVRFFEKGSPISLILPVLVPASVTASSVLEPKVAYQPANLFDSRYDFAWSTNGQATSGKGEWIEIKFDQPQDLSGIVVWNGYQRSEEHFKANGRVAKMTATAGDVSNNFVLGVSRMGSQQVTFAQPMKSTSSVKLTIDDVTPGAKYPDVLLSELRFVDSHGQVLIPQVKGVVPDVNAAISEIVDQSLSSVVCAAAQGDADPESEFQRSLRLRRDGSFVIYNNDVTYEERQTKNNDQVLEGNWESRGSEIRIFGQRYTDTIVSSDYSQATRRVPPSIFQSDLTIARFHDLSLAEQTQLASLILSRVYRESKGVSNQVVTIYGPGYERLAQGTGEKALVASLVNRLGGLNPWTLRSPILADAMLPSDDVGSCGGSN